MNAPVVSSCFAFNQMNMSKKPILMWKNKEIERTKSVNERDSRCEFINFPFLLGMLPIATSCSNTQLIAISGRIDFHSSIFTSLFFSSAFPLEMFALFITCVHMLFNQQKNDEYGKFHA